MTGAALKCGVYWLIIGKGRGHMEELYSVPVENGQPGTILIVDDDPTSRKILGKVFSEFYTIQEAENGITGLKQILDTKDRICAILLDVIMPKMNGIDVLMKLKEVGLTKKIPVFLITAESGMSVVQGAYQLGVMECCAYIHNKQIFTRAEGYRSCDCCDTVNSECVGRCITNFDWHRCLV